MTDPKASIPPGETPDPDSELSADTVKMAVPEPDAELKAKENAELSDPDLETVAGGFGQASLGQAQKNIGQSLTLEGRSLVSSVGLQGNPLIKP